MFKLNNKNTRTTLLTLLLNVNRVALFIFKFLFEVPFGKLTKIIQNYSLKLNRAETILNSCFAIILICNLSIILTYWDSVTNIDSLQSQAIMVGQSHYKPKRSYFLHQFDYVVVANRRPFCEIQYFYQQNQSNNYYMDTVSSFQTQSITYLEPKENN